MEGVRKLVAQNIKIYRERAGLTQQQLADRISVGKTVICNWENEVSSPDINKLYALCKALSVKPTVMMGVVDELAAIEQENQEINRLYQAAPEDIQITVKTLLKQRQPRGN